MELNSKITVNSVSFNIDRSLILLATSMGYRIYKNNSFELLNQIDDVQKEVLGPLKYIQLIGNDSEFVVFNGTEKNNLFPPNMLVIWDDYKKAKEGMIVLNANIIIFKISKNILFILLNTKLLLFNLFDLKYIKTVNLFSNKESFSLEYFDSIYMRKNKTIIFALYEYQNSIIISKIISSNKILFENKTYFEIYQFHFVTLLKLFYNEANNISYLITLNDKKNTIHLYDIGQEPLFINCIYFGKNCICDNWLINFDNYFSYIFVFNNGNKILKYYDFYSLNECNCFKRMEGKKFFKIDKEDKYVNKYIDPEENTKITNLFMGNDKFNNVTIFNNIGRVIYLNFNELNKTLVEERYLKLKFFK